MILTLLGKEPLAFLYTNGASEKSLFTPPANHHSDLFHTTARILPPEGTRPGFGQCTNDTDLCFREELETLNFERVPEIYWQTAIFLSQLHNRVGIEKMIVQRTDQLLTVHHFIGCCFDGLGKGYCW